jgi:tyrosinase
MTLRVEFPSSVGTFSRADLVFLGLEHAGPSVEVRIFFNTPTADESTPLDPAAGFAGFFSIFGHGGCFGDEGHCDMPDRRSADLRPPYPLTPIAKHVTVTSAVRDLLEHGVRDLDVTLVPLLHEIPDYVPDDFLESPVKFQRLSLVFYA